MSSRILPDIYYDDAPDEIVPSKLTLEMKVTGSESEFIGHRKSSMGLNLFGMETEEHTYWPFIRYEYKDGQRCKNTTPFNVVYDGPVALSEHVELQIRWTYGVQKKVKNPYLQCQAFKKGDPRVTCINSIEKVFVIFMHYTLFYVYLFPYVVFLFNIGYLDNVVCWAS